MLRQYSVLAAVSGLVLLASGLALLTYSSQLSQSYRDVLLDLPSLVMLPQSMIWTRFPALSPRRRGRALSVSLREAAGSGSGAG
jgi:hypothetical protein